MSLTREIDVRDDGKSFIRVHWRLRADALSHSSRFRASALGAQRSDGFADSGSKLKVSAAHSNSAATRLELADGRRGYDYKYRVYNGGASNSYKWRYNSGLRELSPTMSTVYGGSIPTHTGARRQRCCGAETGTSSEGTERTRGSVGVVSRRRRP